MSTVSERLAEIQATHIVQEYGAPGGERCDKCETPSPCDAAVLVAALGAVVARHRQNAPEDGTCQGYTRGGYGFMDDWCVECSDNSGREYGIAWPCSTGAALAAALGAEA